MLKFVCTSDTHGKHDFLEIPRGDILVMSGDITDTGREDDLQNFNQYLKSLPHKYKIIINGNHDVFYEFDHGSMKHILTNAIYLEHTEIKIEGIRIWGSSRNPKCIREILIRKGLDVHALERHWDLIPTGIDILITHDPPFGSGDITAYGIHAGSQELLAAIKRVKPRYHIFGHIHDSYGISRLHHDNAEIICVNTSAIIGFSDKLNPPIVFEL